MGLGLTFAWFGVLKVFGLTPATPIVETLHAQIFSYASFDGFYMAFGVYEVVIGLTFLIKGFERATILLLFPYLITSALPLVFASQLTWQDWFVPTGEGQNNIENTILIGVAIGIATQLAPARRHKNKKTEIDKKSKKAG